MTIGRSKAWEDVLPEDYLELSNGKIVKNLVELVEALRDISKDSFKLHVSGPNNDFADWVMDSYGNELLSKKIKKIKTRNKLVKFLDDVVYKSDMADIVKIRAPNKKDTLKILGEISNEM